MQFRVRAGEPSNPSVRSFLRLRAGLVLPRSRGSALIKIVTYPSQIDFRARAGWPRLLFDAGLTAFLPRTRGWAGRQRKVNERDQFAPRPRG